MKSIEQKRKEANERAARSAQLSNQVKLANAEQLAKDGRFGECKREIARLKEKIQAEKSQRELRKEARQVEQKAQEKHRQANAKKR